MFIFQPFASLKPFPTLPTNNSTDSSSGSKPAFTGFTGFSGFKPLVSTSTSVPTLTTSSTLSATPTAASKLSENTVPSSMSLGSVKPFSFMNSNTTGSTLTELDTNKVTSVNSTTTTSSQSSFPSLFTNGGLNHGTTKTAATPSLTTPTTTTSHTTSSSSATAMMTNGDGDHSNSSKNINEIEMKFINGLNELYERCYGGIMTKRQYKLPVNALEMTSGMNGESDQSEAKLVIKLFIYMQT